MSHAHFTDSAEGEVSDLGIIRMRVLVSRKETDGAFALVEFSGDEGPWTVPHIHARMEESFYVLDGSFVFHCGGDDIPASTGSYVLVPRGLRHSMDAGSGGGRFLGLFVPGGLEDMFRELGRLPAGSIRDPQVRAAIAARYDSVPA